MFLVNPYVQLHICFLFGKAILDLHLDVIKQPNKPRVYLDSQLLCYITYYKYFAHSSEEEIGYLIGELWIFGGETFEPAAPGSIGSKVTLSCFWTDEIRVLSNSHFLC